MIWYLENMLGLLGLFIIGYFLAKLIEIVFHVDLSNDIKKHTDLKEYEDE